MKALTILVFNSGSSSLKFSFFRIESSLFDEEIEPQSYTETILNECAPKEAYLIKILFEGVVELSESEYGNNFHIKNASNETLFESSISMKNHADAVEHIIRFMASFETATPDAIAHRVVHGGPNLIEHCFINDKVVSELALSSAFAPLHNQAALEIIEYTRSNFPNLPHIACFDSAFHANLPDIAKILPIGNNLQSFGIHRYGFHGLSCESIIFQLNNASNLRTAKRLVIAHIGNGVSVTAIKNGKSIDTSMGFTPSSGVMMGTRCGDIDPSILIFLMRERNYDLAAIEKLINHQSGLFGISGYSNDIRKLHEVSTTNPNAQLAIEMFCYAIAKQIGAMITVLNGIDTLVFTGGIGEHDAIIRQKVCNQLSYLRVVLDIEENNSINNDQIHTISDKDTSCAVQVLKSQENAQIAQHTSILLKLQPT